VIAAATLFLAREPLWRTLTGMFGRGRRRSEDEGIVTARLDTADENSISPLLRLSGPNLRE
jgi:hypothetical protein